MSEYDKLAELFKIFGDATRVRILFSIKNDEKSVSDIVGELNISQSAVSHQLNTLRMSRLVKVRKHGKSVFYSINDEHVNEILSCGLDHISEVI